MFKQEKPAIGIRPIVDGREGPMQLRQSLEGQVSAMAQAAKKLFEENLRYSDGTPVKVVIASHSIGRVPESSACADEFKKENVAITVSVTPCWCYGAETMDMDPMTIKAVGALTERNGRVLFTLLPFWQRTLKRDCLRSAFTDTKCRIETT